VTVETALSLVALVVGFVAATLAVQRTDARHRLGFANPGVAWLLLMGVFFGLGSVVLAIDGRPGPAAYTSAAAAAFGGGLLASDAIARRRASAREVSPEEGGSTRLAVVALLAVLGVLAVVPTLLQTGLPFLVNDITAARGELAGLSVQVLRVALPGAAAVAVLVAMRGRSPRDRWLATAVVLGIAGFEVLLASRYLLAELGATIALTWLLAGRRIPLRLAGAVVALGLIAFAGIQLVRAYDQAKGHELEFVVDRSVNRVVLIQPRTLDALMTVIPAEHDYFLGLTWVRRLAVLFGRDDIPNLGYWIYPRVVAGDQATVGYAATGWPGEAWANFGWAGIVLFAALGAAVERSAALIAARIRGAAAPNAADLVAAALLVLFVARTHALGVAGLAVLVVLVAAWRVLVAPSAGLRRDLAATLAWRT
jgi:hypothetical protein